MFNFLEIAVIERKKGLIFVEPKFKMTTKDSDVMVRGRDFYAIWDEESGLWRMDESFVIKKVDEAVWDKFNKIRKKRDVTYVPVLMDDSDSGVIDKWHKYVQRQLRDQYSPLDNKVVFSNMETKRHDYISKKLDYPIEEGSTEAWDELIGTLYPEEERLKLEWALGSIISGDSKFIQKFIVLYGDPGSGKGTFLKIVEKMFDGYVATFQAKDLVSFNNTFALEAFKDNPLIAIQNDGDLSKIEDNTLINSIVSHETLLVNEKHKSKYSMRFNTFMFMGTNTPVKITDAKSGLLRRLIDVYPSGNKIERRRYDRLLKQVEYELGAIAYKVKKVFDTYGPNYYDGYIPKKMMAATNDFYDFMDFKYDDYSQVEYITLNDIWTDYKLYCDMAGVLRPLQRREVQLEAGNYFEQLEENYYVNNLHVRNAFIGFKINKFRKVEINSKSKAVLESWIKFDCTTSIFDKLCFDYPAQLANESGKPTMKWQDVKTTLKDINTRSLHYVKMSNTHHIVIDFDIKDKNGNKSLDLNIKAASKWPKTYAELSKSGQGIHLHYIYTGDVNKLSAVYDDNIEVKVFKGNSSLRRLLTKCNDISIATISSGLPLKKEDSQMYDKKVFSNEKSIRRMIVRNLHKEIHADTTSSINFIKRILDDAYASGIVYDVSDMYQSVLYFASCSTHQAANCVKTVEKMHFTSEKEPECVDLTEDAPLVFFDCEVFPNLLLINWKFDGPKNKVQRMFNPTPSEVATLFKYRLVGHNCNRYDNHIVYAAAQGYDNAGIYNLSKRLVSNVAEVQRKAMFNNAKNLSYADTYDFPTKKQSLKKWEIEMGTHHQELGLDWNEPVPEELWERVASYCDYDVLATEMLFHYENHKTGISIPGDFMARKILSALSGLPINAKDNDHSAKLIFGSNKPNKGEFVYTDLSTIFPGYTFDNGKSMYLGEEVGEGGAVRSSPGIYHNVKVLDIVSMHPSSAIALNIFGDRYTKNYKDIVDLRKAIKHGDLDKARSMFDGKLVPYLEDKSLLKAIASALKIVINSVYGMSSAPFDNAFKDPRNIDNIVAKRGALFMLTLKKKLEDMGVHIIHIKTDSIKLEDPSPEIEQFVYDFGNEYGYVFEIENIYEKMCLIDKANYISKNAKTGEWEATGIKFGVPYVFKTLFSKEPIAFDDVCETKEVKTGELYMDFNEKLGPDEHDYRFVGRVGSFIPVKEGCGGAELKVNRPSKPDKYDAPQKTNGYRWLEAESVDRDHYKDIVDISYYAALVDKAKEAISAYGDVEEFII